MDTIIRDKFLKIIADIEGNEFENIDLLCNAKDFKIIINVNEVCNLNCRYCYEKSKNGKIFDPHKAILFLESFNYEKYSNIIIEFRGGEPLLCFSKIKEVMEYIEKQEFSKKISYYMITNGTLMTKEIKDFLLKFKDKFKLVVSLDGPKLITDKNRCNSYDDIKFDLIREICNPISISMTLVPDDIKKLYETLVFFLKNDFKVRTNFELNANWDIYNINEYYCSCMKFIEDYKNYPLGKIFTIFSYGQFAKYSAEVTPSTVNCSCGVNRILLDFDNSTRLCQMFSNSINPNILERPSVINPDKCVTCKVFYGCQFCYGSALKNGGSFQYREKNLCEINTARMLCACYYNIIRIKERKIKNVEDLNRLAKLRNIVEYLLMKE